MTAQLGSKLFEPADQDFFARLSGDHNPMHMDPVAARRTQAGAPVVHGIHNLLTGLNVLAAAHPDLPAIATLKASFSQMVYVGDTVNYRLDALSDSGAVLEASVEGTAVARLGLTFGPPRPPKSPLVLDTAPECPDAAFDLMIEEMAGRSGRIAVPGTLAEITAAFPAAAVYITPARIAAILGTTTLVGMICPGLHSIFGGLTLNTCEPGAETLAWKVTNADPRFRMVRMTVEGLGVWGTVDSFARMPPAPQPSFADVSAHITPGEFAGATCLIIGGSRGLGELTANILAAGGAKTIITYATGAKDAERLAAAITQAGGHCETMPYDVLRPAAPQLASLPAAPTHLYYFATPMIGKRKTGIFAPARHAEFFAYYVTGFHNLVTELHEPGLSALYPSTVFVEDHPPGLAEYAMTKAAGEILCAALNAQLPNTRIVINRLPRLPTDQNATVVAVKTEDPLATMLPLIRAVQGAKPA